MKKHLLIPVLMLPLMVFGQVQGNFKSRSQAPASAPRAYNEQSYSNAIVQFGDTRGQVVSANIIAENVIEFRINGLSNIKADAYTAVFNIVQLGKTAEETNNALTGRLDPFIADMKTAGVKAEDIYIDMVNFLPKFEYDVSKKLFSKKTYTEIPIGFELQKNVHVRFTNPSTLDAIVAAAAKYEIYDIVKVDYFVKNTRDKHQELRNAALSYFQDIRKSYKGVVSLDSAYISLGESSWVAYPGDRYQSYQAFTSQSLDAAQRNDAKVERADKPVSQFYQPIPANDYQIVINPEILEPCVQFSYQLVVRCTLKERQPALKTVTTTRKEFIMVTPQGEVKTLKID